MTRPANMEAHANSSLERSDSCSESLPPHYSTAVSFDNWSGFPSYLPSNQTHVLGGHGHLPPDSSYFEVPTFGHTESGATTKRRKTHHPPVVVQCNDPMSPIHKPHDMSGSSTGEPDSASIGSSMGSSWVSPVSTLTQCIGVGCLSHVCAAFYKPDSHGYAALDITNSGTDDSAVQYSAEKMPDITRSTGTQRIQQSVAMDSQLQFCGQQTSVKHATRTAATFSNNLFVGDMAATDQLISFTPLAPVVPSHPYGSEQRMTYSNLSYESQPASVYGRSSGYSIPVQHAVLIPPWSTTVRNPETAARPSYNFLSSNQKGGKRGPFKDLQLREQTAKTRIIGSCIRCRMQRIRCDSAEGAPVEDPCIQCRKLLNSKAVQFPCLRYKIGDVRLYKSGQVPGYEWSKRWNSNISDAIHHWASPDTRSIHISDGYYEIELQVRQFVPQNGDKLERTWAHGGTKQSVSIPPYALTSLDDGRHAYQQHIDQSTAMNPALQKLLKEPDGLLHKTYDQAICVMMDPNTSPECRELLMLTLRLWKYIRLSTKSGFIVGQETLGMSPQILDETNPLHGKVPLPPVLGAQLDVILTHHIQVPLRRRVLDLLQKLILKNKPSCWFVTYLVIFIWLHNAALITAHDASYARKHGMRRRFAREDMVESYRLGANIFLAHFHFCNKGSHPFSDECTDQQLRVLAQLDDSQIKFIHQSREIAKLHGAYWNRIRSKRNYEDDYYFVSQLFDQNWQPE